MVRSQMNHTFALYIMDSERREFMKFHGLGMFTDKFYQKTLLEDYEIVCVLLLK